MNNSGITNFNVLNTNFLYIQGIAVDFGSTNAFLQGEIDAIEAQLIPIEAITSRIDFNTAPALVGNLVITETNKNSVLLTAIQNINTQIGSLNKLDLSALPALPPGACVITPTTTNQYLNGLITTNTADIVTINGQITTIQGQITTINNSITAINLKLAHFSTFNYGADVMSGIADSTGFACAVSSGSQSGNGIFVYPNTSVQTEQIQLISANDKNILLRGGDQVGIFGAQTATMTNRTLIDIGDKTDIIHIGRNHNIAEYPEIDIGVDYNILTLANASTTNIEGDVYFSSFASVLPVVTQTPLLYGDATPGIKFGNTNNYTLKPVLAGLDVTAVGVVPITLTAVSGLILISNVLGGIALTCVGGAIAMTTGGGLCSISTGAGAVSVSTGTGVMNFATGSGNIEMSTLSGNINIGAGKAAGGTAGNTIIQAKQVVEINPDVETDIYKTAFIEFNDNTAPAPPITANRLYQQGNQLFFDGTALGGGGGNFVLKTGDTMTGALILPETITPIVTLTNLLTPPSPVTNRLYLLNNVLTFNGAAVGGGGAFVPLAGGTMTGALNINYDAGQVTPQLQLTNTNNIAPIGGQGAAINLRNDAAGTGAIGERCGKIDFAGKDSVGNGGRTYAAIQGYINDPTSTAIDGRLSQFVASNNTLTEVTRFISTSTGVRQANIGATSTTIGISAIGSASTETLRVLGTQAISTSLDVPLIQNAPAIYPATSTTLVDNAVRKYQPERLYRLIDYPAPLGPPTTDGEKVIILNNTGAPAGGIDQILQASDFPLVFGSAMTAIIQIKYFAATTNTPPCNFITAEYADNSTSVFVQPDIPSVPLALTRLGRFIRAAGACRVNDFVVTYNNYATQYLYFGGLFDSFQLAIPYGGATASSTNVLGRLELSWSSGAIVSFVYNTMSSFSAAQDSGTTFSNILGVNAEVTSVINVTGNSGFSQPTPPIGTKYDSIVIAGDFVEIGPVGSTYRPLKRLAYYDYSDGLGTATTLINQTTFQNYNAFSSGVQTFGNFVPAVGGSYTTLSAQIKLSYSPDPSDPPVAQFYVELVDSAAVVIATSILEGVTGVLDLTTTLTPEVTLSAGLVYSLRVNVTNFGSITPASFLGYGGIIPPSTPTAYCVFTSVLSAGDIGWRTLDGANWSTPVGADAMIRGGGLFSSGFLGFTYEGNTITTSGGSLTSNRIFSVYYNGSSASFTDMNSDSQAIDSTQTWLIASMVNNVSGGNPTLAYGVGNATAYSELYCNRGYNNIQNLSGVYYRPTSIDPYEMTDTLIFIDNGFPAYQLKPQFSSQASISVYRDNAKYPDVFYIGRGNELVTATLPFSSGVPNYNGVSLPGGVAIPCIGFGGYSSAIGYTGLVLYTPAAAYIDKGSNAGELVIDLSGCVIRCANNIYAQNKLTFPADQDGTSVTLVGDISIVNPYGKPSWWAISQDGGIYYDNVLVNNNAGSSGVTSLAASTGISVSGATGAVTIGNTGVTSIVAGSNITITSTLAGGTGEVTINAAGSGVTSLGQYTLPSGNATPFLLYPALATTGALQGYIQPTKLSYYNAFIGNITIGNGLSIFGTGIAVPGGAVGSSISPNFLNTSHKYKLTCSVSIQDSTGGGNFNGGNHWGNFTMAFANTAIPSTSYGNIWGTQNAQNVGAPIPQQSSGSVFGTSWTDVFVDAVNSPGQYISLGQTFIISYNGNYSATSLSGYVFWELEYIPDP